MSMPLILASASASRKALLAGAGVRAEAVAPGVDEEAAKRALRAEGVSVRDQAMHLAEIKALKVSLSHTGLVIGGDQMLALGERAFDKPKDLVEARGHLEALSGRSHTLETAIAAAENGAVVWRHLARPRLTMRALSPDFIDGYIAQAGTAMLTTVGGYQLEGVGSQLFSRIEGDYFSILGLPLLPLLDYLRLRGVLPT